MTPELINEYAQKIYQQNVERGWWDDPNRSIFQTLQLVNTEIAEATEGDRKNLMDDHLSHRKMAEVEMADTLIRLLDLAGRYGWEYIGPKNGYHRRLDKLDSVVGYHFVITGLVCDFGNYFLDGYIAPESANLASLEDTCWDIIIRYYVLVSSILEVCRRENYDIQAAMDEKLEYNKTRADHSREARAHFDGKKILMNIWICHPESESIIYGDTELLDDGLCNEITVDEAKELVEKGYSISDDDFNRLSNDV